MNVLIILKFLIEKKIQNCALRSNKKTLLYFSFESLTEINSLYSKT
jgi:hypothetical protein